jgi:hypothetical protein
MPKSGPIDPAARLPRDAISPLVPVLAPIAVAAIVISVVFSRVFPHASPGGKAPEARFTNVTAESGIAFVHDNGSREDEDTPSTLSGAVAFLDYENEGRPDLFFVSGTAWPWTRSGMGGARDLRPLPQ